MQNNYLPFEIAIIHKVKMTQHVLKVIVDFRI